MISITPPGYAAGAPDCRLACAVAYAQQVETLAFVTILGAIALGVWALAHIVTDRPVIGRQLAGCLVVEGTILVTAVAAGVEQARGAVTGDLIVLWGYLLTALVVLPVVGGWAFADRTRTSSVALLVGAVTVVVLMWRTVQVAAIV